MSRAEIEVKRAVTLDTIGSPCLSIGPFPFRRNVEDESLFLPRHEILAGPHGEIGAAPVGFVRGGINCSECRQIGGWPDRQ